MLAWVCSGDCMWYVARGRVEGRHTVRPIRAISRAASHTYRATAHPAGARPESYRRVLSGGRAGPRSAGAGDAALLHVLYT